MAIIGSDEITLVRVDDGEDGDDGYSPQVTVTPHQSVPAQSDDVDKIDINVETKDNQTGTITTNTTTIKKADRIYEALQDVTIFNALTNGGELQGMFVDDSGHAYFNGQYLRALGATIGGFDILADRIQTKDVSGGMTGMIQFGDSTNSVTLKGKDFEVDPTTSYYEKGLLIDGNSVVEMYAPTKIGLYAASENHSGFYDEVEGVTIGDNSVQLNTDYDTDYVPTGYTKGKSQLDVHRVYGIALRRFLDSDIYELLVDNDGFTFDAMGNEMTYKEDGILNVPENYKFNGFSVKSSNYTNATINTTNVTDGRILYFTHGDLCTIIFEDVKFTATAHGNSGSSKLAADLIASDLPIPKAVRMFITSPYGTTYHGCRFEIQTDGKLYFHYSGTPTATMQHYGQFTYIMNGSDNPPNVSQNSSTHELDII